MQFFNLLVRVREPVEERERRMVKADARRELIIVTTELPLTDWELKQVFVFSLVFQQRGLEHELHENNRRINIIKMLALSKCYSK